MKTKFAKLPAKLSYVFPQTFFRLEMFSYNKIEVKYDKESSTFETAGWTIDVDTQHAQFPHFSSGSKLNKYDNLSVVHSFHLPRQIIILINHHHLSVPSLAQNLSVQ